MKMEDNELYIIFGILTLIAIFSFALGFKTIREIQEERSDEGFLCMCSSRLLMDSLIIECIDRETKNTFVWLKQKRDFLNSEFVKDNLKYECA